ncbi:Methyl-accepting chemotaxis protein [Thermanaeromonas toyohensis ToBE]|uniref:Methyl-accepting chemotaxis protein n=1 Tax=Thermanaeromonas toyohensis ToBE TaxID=698762 RepID=A0A1W1VNC4_9FIRM|nr:hypothetical protein [Thermanaeromonas toyohensis]SMB94862.1 Methyl-accepting chemotaxis protein [Thermanaeromonas toyohensis ToBE]
MTFKIHVGVRKKELIWSLLFVSLILCITVAYFQYEKVMFLKLTSEINTGNLGTIGWQKYWKNMAFIRITYTASLVAATLLCSLNLARIIWRKRLSQLEAVTELASTGDLRHRLEIPRDEWETLAQRFNNLSFHLANLVDTVKTSTADWQKAIEKLAETLEGSAQARNNFYQHLTYIRESAQEQLNVLIQSTTLANKISEGLKRLDERQKISSQWSSECRGMISETVSILDSVTRQLREFRSAFNKGQEYHELILSQGEPWSHHMISLKSLTGRLASFIIEVALEAAKSGRDDLIASAEELHRSLQNINLLLEETQTRISKLLDIVQVDLKAAQRILAELNLLEEQCSSLQDTWQELEGKMRAKEALEQEEIQERYGELKESAQILVQSLEEPLSVLRNLLLHWPKEEGEPDWAEIHIHLKRLLRLGERLHALAAQYKI